jgi:EpsI family protein
MAIASGAKMRAGRWTQVSPVAVVLAVAFLMLWPSLVELEHYWRTIRDYEHGYLVALLTAVWLFRARKEIDAAAVPARPIAALPLAITIVIWLVALRANSNAGQHLIIPLVPLLAVLAAAGPRAARLAALPLTYLYFAIPLWDVFTPSLQAMTTSVAEHVLGAFGIPVTVTGNDVTIPYGTFTVADTCSGKRYLVVGLAFAVLAGVIQRLPRQRFAMLLVLSAAAALAANWLRVIVIIYAGYATKMQHYLVTTDHVTFGTVLFVPLLAAILLLTRSLARNAPLPALSHERGTATSAGTVAWLFPVALMLGAALLNLFGPNTAAAAPALRPLPLHTDGWRGPIPADGAWQPRFIGAGAERRAAYVAGPDTIELYVNIYGVQSQGRELVYYENTLPSPGWHEVESLPSVPDSPAAAIVAEDGSSNLWVVSHVYNVGGRVTGSAVIAQVSYGFKALLRPVPAGVVAVAARCAGRNCEGARDLVQRFWRDNGGQVIAVIPAEIERAPGSGDLPGPQK